MNSNKMQMAQMFAIYAVGFLAIATMELLSINQNFGESEATIVFSFKKIIDRLPIMITSYIALVCYIVATLGRQVYKFKTEDKNYLNYSQKIQNWAATQYRPTIFNKFAAHLNKKRKINAYKHALNIEWQKLEDKQTEKDLNAWIAYQKQREENPSASTENEYCQKRLVLEEKLSDEYIKENIDKIIIKYDEITSGVVLGGGVKKNKDEVQGNEFITKNPYGLALIERSWPSLAIMGVMLLATSIGAENFRLTTNWIAWVLFTFKLIVRIGSMLYAIYGTIKYSDSFNERVTLKDIRFRWGVCCEHDQWVNQQKKIPKEDSHENNINR